VNASNRQPMLVIHGGAWAMPDDAVEAHERGIRAALAAGWSALERGAEAADAVVEAVTVLEDDDTFDAGRGSFLTRDGRVQMDALLMQGKDLRAGGVACVERLRNPIQAARLVLDQSPHVYFVGIGAEKFVAQHGMRLIDNTELIVPREKQRLMKFQLAEAGGGKDLTFSGETSAEAAHSKADLEVAAQVHEAAALQSHDTVGAVALDAHGHLAAGTSTGGTLSKAPGRVGDSSLIGCGCYADDESAAVSLTGWGEPIMKLVLGKRAVDRVASGDAPQDAAEEAIAHLYRRLGGHGGIILLAPDGRMGIAHNTPRMAWGVADSGGMRLGMTRNI
jgi:beta-aspartyl-peptidase (threonine type)